MGGTRGNNPLAKSIDSGARWTQVNPGEGNDPQTPFQQTLAIAPNDPTRACPQDILYFRLLAKA